MTNLWGVLLQTCSVSPGGRTASGAEKGMEADPFPTLAVCFVGNFGGPNFISGYYDRKVPAFCPSLFWVETLKLWLRGTCPPPIRLLRDDTGDSPYSMDCWPSIQRDRLAVPSLQLRGGGVMLLRYLLAYLRLRCCLRLGHPASLEVQRTVHEIGKRYALRVCRVVVLPGLSSPLVFGVLRPVMVLPEGTVDEAVLLHELLHIKYWDALQNSVWCICRALHWCNPWFAWPLTVRNWIWNPSVTSGCWSGWREARRAYGYTLLLWPMAAILAFRGPLPWPTAAEISAGALR